MIFVDKYGYPVDETMDGGDSAMRAGILSIVTKDDYHVEHYAYPDGMCVRHIEQKPWNNPENFTKDQLKCLVAGLHARGRVELCERILQAHTKRDSRCQNSERDFVGTTKHWYPHRVKNFQRFNLEGKTATERSAILDPHFISGNDYRIDNGWATLFDKPTWRLFDGADILFPNDVLFLEVAAGRKWNDIENLEFKLCIHELAMQIHAKSTHNEENQMFAECFVLGTLRQYREINKRFNARNSKYYAIDRNEIEYHELMSVFLERQ